MGQSATEVACVLGSLVIGQVLERGRLLPDLPKPRPPVLPIIERTYPKP